MFCLLVASVPYDYLTQAEAGRGCWMPLNGMVVSQHVGVGNQTMTRKTVQFTSPSHHLWKKKKMVLRLLFKNCQI